MDLSVAGDLDGAGDEGVVWSLWACDGWHGGGDGWDPYDWCLWRSGRGVGWKGGGADWVLGGWDGLPVGGEGFGSGLWLRHGRFRGYLNNKRVQESRKPQNKVVVRW